jgi:hypothetical protein
MTEYLMSQGYSTEEIQTILEEVEYQYVRGGTFYSELLDEDLEAWVAADPYAYEGEPVDIEVFETFPF